MSHEFPDPIPQPPKQETESPVRIDVSELSPQHTLQAKEWLAKYDALPKGPKISPEDQQLIERHLDEALTYCERTHPLQKLYAVTELDAKDVYNNPEKYPERTNLKEDLIPIVGTLNLLKERTDISSVKYEEFKARYKYLSRAVGIINNGKVDHNR